MWSADRELLCRRAGIPLTIKERLGHSSITVTMDRYGHLFPAQDQALAESLDSVLRASLDRPDWTKLATVTP